MRFSVLPILLAGAGLVSANPMRVIVVSSEISALRFGHAVPSVEHPIDHTILIHPIMNGQHRAPCGGRKGKVATALRQKATDLKNAFRQALGLPLIEGENSHVNSLQYIRPMAAPHTDNVVNILPIGDAAPEGHRHFAPIMHIHRTSTFGDRIHTALMTLGPWEGRAVAFVIGCGLGVLIRMLWVFAVVAYRMVKGNNNSDEVEYNQVSSSDDAEAILVAAPQYTYADEKDIIKVVEPKSATV